MIDTLPPEIVFFFQEIQIILFVNENNLWIKILNDLTPVMYFWKTI
jgi:hypothetical protein